MTPNVGDLVGLPAWWPDLPYRVLAVRDPGIAGWTRLDGYLVLPTGGVRLVEPLVPIGQLRGLPDPMWSR